MAWGSRRAGVADTVAEGRGAQEAHAQTKGDPGEKEKKTIALDCMAEHHTRNKERYT